MKIIGLYKKRGIWYYQPAQVKGIRPKAVSLRTRDDQIALQRFEALSRADSAVMRGGSLKLEIMRYVAYQLDNGYHSSATSRSTEEALKRLADFLGEGREINGIQTEDLVRFQQALQKTQVAGTTKALLGRVSGFFTWAVAEGLCRTNPAKALKLPKSIKTRAEDYLTRDERERLMAEIPRLDLALVLWLGFFAGLRIREITEARVNWIDLREGVITVRNTDTFTSKDKSHRRIRMSSRLQGFLTSYLEQWPTLPGAGDTDFLLRPDKRVGKKVRDRKLRAWRYRYDPRKPFKKFVTSRGLGWVDFHSMRHTWATLHAISGTPLTTIARELGDDPGTTFRHYVGYTRGNDHSSVTD